VLKDADSLFMEVCMATRGWYSSWGYQTTTDPKLCWMGSSMEWENTAFHLVCSHPYNIYFVLWALHFMVINAVLIMVEKILKSPNLCWRIAGSTEEVSWPGVRYTIRGLNGCGWMSIMGLYTFFNPWSIPARLLKDSILIYFRMLIIMKIYRMSPISEKMI
jgi:hypothetical protein